MPENRPDDSRRPCRRQPPAQDLRRDRRRRRCLADRPPGRDLRHPRPERCRQDHHRRVDRRTPYAGRRHGPGGRPGPAQAAYRDHLAGRRAAPGQRIAGADQDARGSRAVRVLLPEPRGSGRAAGAARTDQGAEHRLRQAVRRPEAAPVDRAGADRQPEDRHPRRAHHRARPAGAPGHLGAGQADPRLRRDDHPGHALHGGGRVPLRSDRHHRCRPSGRAGHPGRPGRGGQVRAADHLPGRR